MAFLSTLRLTLPGRDLGVDESGFEAEMERQRARARAASRFSVQDGDAIRIEADTEFAGYDDVDADGRVAGLFSVDDEGASTEVDVLESGQRESLYSTGLRSTRSRAVR